MREYRAQKSLPCESNYELRQWLLFSYGGRFECPEKSELNL